MGLFVATISLIQYSHLLMVRLAASLASEEFNALSSVLMSFFLYLNSANASSLFSFLFSKIVELWTKRKFRCDCGNSKFGGHLCKLCPEKDSENLENCYNHNFKGSYCTCGRPYPDPEAKEQVEMIQCCICEDWFHEDHIGLNSIEEVIYLQLSYLMALYLLTSFYVLFLLYLHGCILYAIVPLYTSVAQKNFLVVMSFLLVNVLFCS